MVPWSETKVPEEEALRLAVAQRPEDPEARRRLGEYYLGRVLPFEAIWELEAARARLPGDMPVRLRMAAALDAVSLPALAAEILKEPGSDPDADLSRRLALARLQLKRADARAARRALTGVEETLNASPEGTLLLGRVLQAGGDREGAEAAFRRHLKLSPGSAEGYYRLGRFLLEAGRPADARAVLVTGGEAAPQDARFPFYVGLTYLSTRSLAGDERPSKAALARARMLFGEALRLAPGHALPQYQLGRLDAWEGRWDPAARHFKSATEADPSYADAYRELAGALTKLGKRHYAAYYRGLYYSKVERPADAVRAFRDLALARPESSEGALLVSRMYIQTMQYREATAATEPALRRFPRDPEVYERLATLYKLIGSRGALERLCRQWREALPEASEPHWVQGKVWVTDGRVEEGIREYEQALAREPERAEYLLFLGQALAGRGAAGDFPRALDLLGRSVRAAPRDATARFQLALLLSRLNRPEEAREQLLRALDLDPHQAASYNALAQAAAQLKAPAHARLFGRAVREVEARLRVERQVMQQVWARPRDPTAHLAAARFRRAAGALPQAKAHLDQAVELRPGWPEAMAERERVRLALEAL
jgi:tetratricopeptide (TPR) repeat protein